MKDNNILGGGELLDNVLEYIRNDKLHSLIFSYGKETARFGNTFLSEAEQERIDLIGREILAELNANQTP